MAREQEQGLNAAVGAVEAGTGSGAGAVAGVCAVAGAGAIASAPASGTVLVTGGAGFIGSNFVPFFCKRHPEYLVLNLDKLTYAGSRDNLSECCKCTNYRFVQADICNQAFLRQLFLQYDVRGVIHFAAESHVDNSITGPQAFMESNIMGTFNLLQCAYLQWMVGPHQVKAGYESCRFHQISTDEVYGSLGDTGLFSESSPFAPNSPYSASKASADMIVRAYNRTYGLNTTTSHCSNNYGPKQHEEKLIPKVIACCLENKPIPVYGSGKNVRDWIYVMDHVQAVDVIFQQGRAGESYNVGGHQELDNLTLVHKICALLDELHPRDSGSYAELVTHVKDRAGHDFRYAIDDSKLRTELGWQPKETFDTGLKKTVQWYLTHALS